MKKKIRKLKNKFKYNIKLFTTKKEIKITIKINIKNTKNK